MLKAGISDYDVQAVLDNEVDHALALKAVRDVVASEVQAWLNVRAKVTPGMWDYYEATNERGLIECRQLRVAERALRDAWRRRVKPFFKETDAERARGRALDAAERGRKTLAEADAREQSSEQQQD